MSELLQQYSSVIIGVHLFGVVIGYGGALISDMLFFKFAKNFTISTFEHSVLKQMSLIIWLGVTIIIISGIALFLSAPEFFSQSPKFITKMFVVFIIVCNGLLLNFYATPKLTKIHFGKMTKAEKPLRKSRKIIFALGAVSASSWTTAFILGLLRGVRLPLEVMLLIYLTVVVSAVLLSQFAEKFVHLRKFI